VPALALPWHLLGELADEDGDANLAVAVLAHDAERAGPEEALALSIAIGRRAAAGGLHDRAVTSFRQALERAPGHRIARRGLEASLTATRDVGALTDLALTDLKEATDVAGRVGAYMRLAALDAQLRGDEASALGSYEAVVEIDPAHQLSLRILERSHLAAKRIPELLALYHQRGLTVQDPTFSTAIHRLRARLRVKHPPADLTAADVTAAIDNDMRLALFKDGRAASVLRFLLGRARARNDLVQAAELWARLAELAREGGSDSRAPALCLTRAAEALADLGREDEAAERVDAALAALGTYVPALVLRLRLALKRTDLRAALDSAERLVAELTGAAERLKHAWLAVELAAQAQDIEAERRALTRVLELAPADREAHERLIALLEAAGDHQAIADALEARLRVETDGGRLTAIHLRLAVVARDRLGDRERARAELKRVLEQDATHVEASRALADLYWEGQQWPEAAEALIRFAKLVRTRDALKQVFFRLGVIYSEHVPDPKRAVAAFERVLQATPDDREALDHLATLYSREWNWPKALQATGRLVELEPDRSRKLGYLVRVARIHEDGLKDTRRALEVYRHALEIDPLDMTTIAELAKFYERQKDVQSMRVHLDRAAGHMRAMLERDPLDANAHHALFRIATWRRSQDRALAVAGVLQYIGAADADERALLDRHNARRGAVPSALVDPTVDETLFDSRIPPGFRHMFRVLAEPLFKLYRTDVKHLGVQKSERLPSGHAIRDLAAKCASDFGVRDFEVYVTAAHPTTVLFELTDPPALIIGQNLVEGVHEQELQFWLGRSFKMLTSHMALAMRLGAAELGLLVAGIVRQFAPEFVPGGYTEQQIAEEAQRLQKLIPKKLHGDLAPFALECAAPGLDLTHLGRAVVHTANRAGVLATGAVAPALSALARIGDDAQLRTFVRFCVSEDHAELRRVVGINID
jgi:tetratricopeptide (TPR) repeat protein